MNSEVARALGSLYGVFAPYKDPFGLARQSGVSHHLRDLTREDWDKMNTEFDMGVLIYSDEAVLLRHFLPRFLEWISDDSIPHHVFELWDIGYRLNHFRWLEWPSSEVEALRAVFQAWAHELLTDPEAQMPIEFLIDIKEDLTFYLDTWLQARPHELAQWLWTLDWQKNQNAWQWAIEPYVEQELEAEFFRHPDGEQARSLSRVIELVRSLRG